MKSRRAVVSSISIFSNGLCAAFVVYTDRRPVDTAMLEAMPRTLTPRGSDDESICVVCNGEIYNYHDRATSKYFLADKLAI